MKTQPEFSFEEMAWVISDSLADYGLDLPEIAHGRGGLGFWNFATRNLNEYIHEASDFPPGFVTPGCLKRNVKDKWGSLCRRIQEIYDGDTVFRDSDELRLNLERRGFVG
jgi:hypothetical protein